MNLKESFQYQSFLQNLIDQTRSLLMDGNVTCKTELTYFYSKACKGADDETVEQQPYCKVADVAGKADQLIEFISYLMAEKVKLTKAIKEAKQKSPIDIDVETSLNNTRQGIRDSLKAIAGLRSSEEIQPKAGTGYTFNNDGNQVTYRCDVKKVTTINFNRNHVLKMILALESECEDTSTAIDKALISTEVGYSRPFSVAETYEDIFNKYCASSAEG